MSNKEDIQNLENKIDLLDSKQDEKHEFLKDRINRIEEHISEIRVDVHYHIKRTDLNENRIYSVEENMQRLQQESINNMKELKDKLDNNFFSLLGKLFSKISDFIRSKVGFITSVITLFGFISFIIKRFF